MLFISSSYWYWLKLPVLCFRRIVREDVFALSQILGRKHSVFHYVLGQSQAVRSDATGWKWPRAFTWASGEPPPRLFPFWSQCCVWTGPGGSYHDCKKCLSDDHQGTWKRKVGYLQELEEGAWHAWGLTVGWWVESADWAAAFTVADGEVPGVLWVLCWWM